MSMFSLLKRTGSEQIKFCAEKKSNFKAIIAVNSTALGPALGDITFIPETSDYRQATSCACTLSQKMTKVYSFLGLHYGGGKIIALGKPTPGYEEIYYRSLARHIRNLNGRFIIRSASYMNKKLLDYIKVETEHVLEQSEVVNDAAVLIKIKHIAVVSALKEVSTKMFHNRELAKLKIGFIGNAEDFSSFKWLTDKYPNIKTFQSAADLSSAENDFEILLVSPTTSNSARLQDIFKVNFKSAVGIREEESDMEECENSMSARNIPYIPGYLVENLECFFYSQNNTDNIRGKDPDFGPFEIFVREKLAYLFDESLKRKVKISNIIGEFADSRIEMLQLIK